MTPDPSSLNVSCLPEAREEGLPAPQLWHLIKLMRELLWHRPAIRRQLQEVGINVVPANFYSAIPSFQEIENAFEYSRGDQKQWFNTGQFDHAAISAWIACLEQFAHEFDPPLDPVAAEPDHFYWRNPAFSFCDAMTYYCLLRSLRPEHVVEIGCGFSSMVADMALRRNGKGSLTLIEPYPKPFLRELKTLKLLIERPVQSLEIQQLVEIAESADVLFIDSTHTVKVGSDCLTLYLRLLPQIGKRILVHAHDIHLPYGLPQSDALDKHIYWTEQYLLYAYLLDNPKARVLYSSQYMHRTSKDVLDRFMQGRYRSGGGSIWFELDPSRAQASPPPT